MVERIPSDVALVVLAQGRVARCHARLLNALRLFRITFMWTALWVIPLQASAQKIVPTERRIALVIGNNRYESLDELKNAVADARAVAQAFKDRGFEVVEGYDLNRRAMLQLVNRFSERLPQYDVAMFYFSGHGAQLRGKNYIIPVGAKMNNEDDLADDAVSVSTVAERMQATNRQAFDLLIIDACRNSPFSLPGRSGSRLKGLSAPEANGVMILQAAGANQEALDNLGPDDKDPHGVFVREWLKGIKRPAVPIREMMIGLREAVRRDAALIGREQVPAVYDEAIGDFIFTPGPPPPPVDPSKAAFELVASSTEPVDLVTFLKTYPTSPYHGQAVARLNALLGSSVSPDSPLAKPELLVGLRSVDAPLIAPTIEQPSQNVAVPNDKKHTLEQLRQLGHFNGVLSNEFGPVAHTAMRQFQLFQGDPQTGTLTSEEQNALDTESSKLAALLHVPDHSPRGIPAATVQKLDDRLRKAWALEASGKLQPQNFVEATYWYTLAAGQNNRNALLALGNLKVRGQGLDNPDYAAAQLLWRAAAARGEGSAAFNLGAMAEHGIGGPPDKTLAARWFRVAVALGESRGWFALKGMGL